MSLEENKNRFLCMFSLPEDRVIICNDVPGEARFLLCQVINNGHRFRAVAALRVGHAQRHGWNAFIFYCTY